jgi:hypothetical protein
MNSWSHLGCIVPESPVNAGVSLGLLSRGSQVRVLPGALTTSHNLARSRRKPEGSGRGSMHVVRQGRMVSHDLAARSWSHSGRIGVI